MKRFLITLIAALMMALGSAGAVSAADNGSELIAAASSALIHASDGDWTGASDALGRFEAAWTAAGTGGGAKAAQAKAVTDRLNEAKRAVKDAAKSPKAASEAISALAKAADGYLTAENGTAAGGQARDKVKSLLPLVERSLAAAGSGDSAGAKSAFEEFVGAWGKAEGAVRSDNASLYGSMEVKISGARIALNTEPFAAAKAREKLQELSAALGAYASGTAAGDEAAAADGTGIRSVADLLALTEAAAKDVSAGDAAAAGAKMDRFIAAWPSVEGEVSTRSSQAYSRIETRMVAIPSLLLSEPPKLAEASAKLEELRTELAPYADASAYTAWDAALILLREGIEAILVIVALLTFLKRSGHADKRRWIWSGAWAGILVSVVLAAVLKMALSGLMAGSSRELIEGVTGLVAVLFMLTVGAWLHKKSHLQEWNRFVSRSIGDSLARGTLWSLAATSFLAVMREGAETLIFFMGMAPSISASQLALGIGVALAILAAVGYVIVALGSRMPVRPFFLVAGVMLYYLAFKFVGVSLHALQVAGRLPSHEASALPELPSIGLYASWETALPQLLVLALILWSVVRTEAGARPVAERTAA
ncbi:FTR1 family iron permease [Gorillibacterium sp. sgz5001074]|uniref:FTR1 family iron permease n=1 Tax=Gorillibacterium sp. sgz5001074 TaxID=3446695 RepID=UPI003F67A036